jgi:hypothetical protein
VKIHGICSFRDLVRCRGDYGYTQGRQGILLFGQVKLWGEVIEHQAGYRSEFARIVSLDYGDPELLQKFRQIYGLDAGSMAGFFD